MSSDPRSLSFHGVGFGAYAAARAGLADELPLAELLEWLRIAPDAWPLAVEAWEAATIDDLDAEGPLADGLVTAMRQVRKQWARPLPPLDADLAAYLDFDRAFAEEIDETAFLAPFGMTPSDMDRLAVLWEERMAADPALRDRAIALLCEPPGPLCHPKPAPAKLRAPTR